MIMANQPGRRVFPRGHFRRGMILTASDMNRIVNALVRRIEGGKGINVRSFNGRIIIEASDT